MSKWWVVLALSALYVVLVYFSGKIAAPIGLQMEVLP